MYYPKPLDRVFWSFCGEPEVPATIIRFAVLPNNHGQFWIVRADHHPIEQLAEIQELRLMEYHERVAPPERYDHVWSTVPVPIDYTCTCGLYVHPTKRNSKAIHIQDCPYNGCS